MPTSSPSKTCPPPGSGNRLGKSLQTSDTPDITYFNLPPLVAPAQQTTLQPVQPVNNYGQLLLYTNQHSWPVNLATWGLRAILCNNSATLNHLTALTNYLYTLTLACTWNPFTKQIVCSVFPSTASHELPQPYIINSSIPYTAMHLQYAQYIQYQPTHYPVYAVHGPVCCIAVVQYICIFMPT